MANVFIEALRVKTFFWPLEMLQLAIDKSFWQPLVWNGLLALQNGEEPLLDNFIVVSEMPPNERIFQISLDNINASALDLNSTFVPRMAYDAVEKRIIWTDEEGLWYKQISPVRSKVQIGYNTDDRAISHFDMDYSTGNIYLIYVHFKEPESIGLISPDGLNRTLTHFTDYVVDIALDPPSGFIFWIEGYKHIKRMNMDGTTQITLVSMDLGSPFGLTIDKRNKTIYVRSSTGNIHRCGYEPNTCAMFYNAEYVGDLIVVGDYLYYSGKGGQLYCAIYISGPTTKCSSNNGRGQCSTFCHPTPNGYTCGCQDGDQLMTDNKTCKLGPRPTDDTTAESGEYTINAASSTSKAYPAFKREVTDTGSSSKLLYIGVSVGSVIVILVAAITIVIIRKRSRANVQLHFGARYFRRKPTDDPSDVINTRTQNIVDSNINPAMLDAIPDLNRDMDVTSVLVNPYLELEDGNTYDCISEGGLQLNRALPPLPDDTGGPLRGSVDGGYITAVNT
ncbi:low-density lipoprotein receptor-related protein 1B-like [Dreissena polymorpha]|uniref:low-density lipoprotein receptor-related protein 1B-like n=1 Tax=Dreissena polymorpha TaxID=45954 RepID=UPI00226515BD|nr:low-density lipoprotein receptor-related protein 1B-like [Dreissena polymorpha]